MESKSDQWRKVLASGDPEQINELTEYLRGRMEPNRLARLSEGYTPGGTVALTYSIAEAGLNAPEQKPLSELQLKLLDEYLAKHNLIKYRKANEIQVGDAIVLKYTLRKGAKEYPESYDVLGHYDKGLIVRHTCLHTSDYDRQIPMPTARNFILGIRCMDNNDSAPMPKATGKPKHYFFFT